MEAMQYFSRRVNDGSISDTMLRLESAYSDRKEEIHSILIRIMELDNLLSSSLTLDMERLNFFFRRFEGIKDTDSIGTCAASMIFFESACRNTGGLPQILAQLENIPMSNVRASLRNTFSNHVPVSKCSELSFEEFWDFAESCPFPDETKWRIVDVCRNYHDYMMELAAILEPAMEIISQQEAYYSDIINNYLETADDDSSMIDYIHSITGIDITDFSKVELYPGLMDFNSALFLLPDNDDEPLKIFIGVLMRLICRKNISINPCDLSQQLKSMGDNTRFEMLCSIKGHPTYGQELSNQFNVSPTTVYHHMNKLIVAGLVNSKLDGNRVYFSLNRPNVVSLICRLSMLLLDVEPSDIS